MGPGVCVGTSDGRQGPTGRLGHDFEGIIATARGRFAWAMGYRFEVPWIESQMFSRISEGLLHGLDLDGIARAKAGVLSRLRVGDHEGLTAYVPQYLTRFHRWLAMGTLEDGKAFYQQLFGHPEIVNIAEFLAGSCLLAESGCLASGRADSSVPPA